MQGVDAGLGAGGLDDGAVGVVEHFFAGSGEERLIELGGETPRGALLGHGFMGGKFEADETASVGEEVDHAFGPSRSCLWGESAEELKHRELAIGAQKSARSWLRGLDVLCSRILDQTCHRCRRLWPTHR